MGPGGSSGSTGGSVLPPEVVISAIQAYNQGVDLMHAQKFAAARVKFEQAIQANPRLAEAHKNLGFTLSQQGPQNYSKALEHYNKAIQIKPKMAEVYEYRAKLEDGKKSRCRKRPCYAQEVEPEAGRRALADLRDWGLDSGILTPRLLGLMSLTGRRPAEIFFSASFSLLGLRRSGRSQC